MSDHAARSALARMNMREVAVAAHYTGLANDLQLLAAADPVLAEASFMARRDELVSAYGMEPAPQNKPFAFSSGIAVIPVHGTLINRFGGSYGYVTGYNFIRQQTAMAAADPDVLGIVYDHNSYGGEAAGCFECAGDIPRLAAGKPTLAVVDSNAYSASYALASAADKIVVTPSGGVGSIGVVALHVSYEAALEKEGVKITFIHAGDHKVDGNPYQDLPPKVKADMQKSIDVSYSAFAALVADGRAMDEKDVRATEARTYRADDALALGLIDAVATPQEAMLAFLGELTGSNPQPQKEDAMSDATKPGANTQATPEQLATAQAEARTAERARVSGIQTCDESKGRAELASHLAFKTSMTVDEAKAILAAAPAQGTDTKAATTGNAFKEAMDNGKHPAVGADGGDAAGGEDNPAKLILSAARMAGVRGLAAAKV